MTDARPGTVSLQQSVDRSARPVAVEFGFATAALVVVYLWSRAIRAAAGPLSAALDLPSFAGLPVDLLAVNALFLVGLALIVAAYVTVRDVDVGLALPGRTDLALLGAAVAVPPVLVGVTALVGAITGVPYGSLTNTAYGPDATLAPVLFVVAAGLSVGVPGLVLVCQVLVQGSFEREFDGERAVVLTTLVTGFAMTGHSGLATVPPRGKLAGAVLFALLLPVAPYAAGRVTRRGLRSLAYLPACLFVVVVVASAAVAVESVAGALFAFTRLAVLGVTAYTYGRSRSLLLPALAYLTLSLADYAVVVLAEGVLSLPSLPL